MTNMMATHHLPHPENLHKGERWRIDYSDHTSTSHVVGEFKAIVCEYSTLWLVIRADGEHAARSIPWLSIKDMRRVK